VIVVAVGIRPGEPWFELELDETELLAADLTERATCS
jgi:hypothetical protein